MLNLSFAVQAGAVELSCDPHSSPALNRLASRFPTTASLGRSAIHIALDDFLFNLHELGTWPDDNFVWQPELLAVVQDNYNDSRLISDRLAAPQDRPATQVEMPEGGWEGSLTSFQRRDLAALSSLRHGANFSVPGAGKTRVALALFQNRRTSGAVARMLVVCPKSAFDAWHEESEICLPGALSLAHLTGSSPPECDVLLVNYERLPDAVGALQRWLRAQPAMLVLDEAHRMKLGLDGAWGAACYALGPYARHRVILTGTPAPNGSQDLANLFGFVWPGQGRFIVNSAIADGNVSAASAALKPLFTRTTKAELELPPVSLAIRRVTLPPLHREIYDALVGMATQQYPGGTQEAEALGRVLLYLIMAATTPALVAAGASRYEPLAYRVPPLSPPRGSRLSELMRDLPSYEMSPKYAEALTIVRQNAEIGRKTIVWSTFIRNLTSLKRLLGRYSPAVVHGGSLDRDEQLRRFRDDPDCLVLLTNPATLGEGISLHHVCHDSVYLDRDFAAGRYLQSLDRIHRLGLEPGTQTRVTILVADQTIDDLVEQRLDMKVNFLLRILDDPALQQLTGLDDEPSEAADLDQDDLAALVAYLHGHVSA